MQHPLKSPLSGVSSEPGSGLHDRLCRHRRRRVECIGEHRFASNNQLSVDFGGPPSEGLFVFGSVRRRYPGYPCERRAGDDERDEETVIPIEQSSQGCREHSAGENVAQVGNR